MIFRSAGKSPGNGTFKMVILNVYHQCEFPMIYLSLLSAIFKLNKDSSEAPNLQHTGVEKNPKQYAFMYSSKLSIFEPRHTNE